MRSYSRLCAAAGAVTLALGLSVGAGAGQAQAATTHWRQVYQSWSWSSNQLKGVVALSAGNAWAVGSSHTSAIVMHWNGSKWSRVTVPDAAGFHPTAVAASSWNNVWAVGTVSGSATGRILRWNGSAWQLIPLPDGVVGQSPVVLSPTDAWVLGTDLCSGGGCTSTLLHWDGSGWTPFAVAAAIYALAGSSAKNVWAVGLQGDLIHLAAYRWNGGSWNWVSSVPHPEISGTPRVTAPSAHNVWIGGWLAKSGTPIFALHWNGSGWQEHTTPLILASGAFLNAEGTLVTDGHGGLWMGPYVHWTGTAWRSVAPGVNTSAFDIAAIARVPGSYSLWGVGKRYRSAGSNIWESLIAVHGTMP